MVSIFDGCDDSCGWTAAIISALAYGSFGVPIKETVHIEVHPLVLQSYKTITMFVLSWLVLLLGVSVSWTPWGLVSGTLWVLGGTGGIFAIRMAGMAIAVGTWASVMIVVNFVWGILIFKEPVAHISSTVFAFSLLGLGLVGMSQYSAPPPKETALSETSEHSQSHLLDRDDDLDDMVNRRGIQRTNSSHYAGETPPRSGEVAAFEILTETLEKPKDPDMFIMFGIVMTKRTAGIIGAVFNGLMTGSSLIPLHYAKQHGFGGANYMISYASGAVMANIAIWGVFFAYHFMQQRISDLSGSQMWQTYNSMPAWHVRQLWWPGFVAGFLLTIAMFGSILAVTYLGQGIGNSVVQSKILISGLWGIFWYKEITGCDTISKWFAAASLTVLGIIWLSHERMVATKSGRRDLLTVIIDAIIPNEE